MVGLEVITHASLQGDCRHSSGSITHVEIIPILGYVGVDERRGWQFGGASDCGKIEAKDVVSSADEGVVT